MARLPNLGVLWLILNLIRLLVVKPAQRYKIVLVYTIKYLSLGVARK